MIKLHVFNRLYPRLTDTACPCSVCIKCVYLSSMLMRVQIHMLYRYCLPTSRRFYVRAGLPSDFPSPRYGPPQQCPYTVLASLPLIGILPSVADRLPAMALPHLQRELCRAHFRCAPPSWLIISKLGNFHWRTIWEKPSACGGREHIPRPCICHNCAGHAECEYGCSIYLHAGVPAGVLHLCYKGYMRLGKPPDGDERPAARPRQGSPIAAYHYRSHCKCYAAYCVSDRSSICAMQINVFLWPWLAVLLEHDLYDARNPSTSHFTWAWAFWRKRSRNSANVHTLPSDTAISIQNLGKDFQTSLFRRDKGLVTAISDLSLNIPKYGIYVLLGSNGSVHQIWFL